MKKPMNKVYVVAYGRSAVGKSGKKGVFRQTHPIELAGAVMKGVVSKLPELDPAKIDDVIVGCAQPEKTQALNIARMIANRAGLPESVPAVTVNRFCSSGLQAIDMAAAMIEAGQYNCVVAGGVESMSTVPMPTSDEAKAFINPWTYKHQPGFYMPMGITAENVAAYCNVTRKEMDLFAVESHRRAAAAQDAGKFDDEIIPVPGIDEEGTPITVTKDQGIRRGTTEESLAALNPCFVQNGVVTAATSSQTSDGASFVILMDGETVKETGVKPIAKFIGCAFAGCDPTKMGLGPIYAVPKVLELTGLKIEDMDVIELNEAFAAQAIPCIKELGMDPAKVNPNGGAIALGHAMGATGGVLTCKALAELKRIGGKYAMVTMCIGGGQGAAAIYEMV